MCSVTIGNDVIGRGMIFEQQSVPLGSVYERLAVGSECLNGSDCRQSWRVAERQTSASTGSETRPQVNDSRRAEPASRIARAISI
jgi:hypothetical protein